MHVLINKQLQILQNASVLPWKGLKDFFLITNISGGNMTLCGGQQIAGEPRVKRICITTAQTTRCINMYSRVIKISLLTTASTSLYLLTYLGAWGSVVVKALRY